MRSALPVVHPVFDSFDGVAAHASQRVNVAVVVKTARAACARPRREPRVASTATAVVGEQLIQPRYHGESDDGTQQLPMMNVLRRDGSTIRQRWGSELLFEPSDPARTRGTATRSTRCGTRSTLRPTDAAPTGTRPQLPREVAAVR